MNRAAKLDTLEKRRLAAEQVLRLIPERMSPAELDWAMALLLQKVIADAPTCQDPPKVFKAGEWVPFSPTRNWSDHGEVISEVELVLGTHALYEDPEDSDKRTGAYYSCHAFFGETRSEGRDLRLTTGRACAKLLAHAVRYAPEWGN